MATRKKATKKRKKNSPAQKPEDDDRVLTIGGLQTEYIDSGEDLPTFFINNVYFEASNDEVRLDLGEIMKRIPEENTIKVKRRMRIYLSWSHTQRFSELLRGQLLAREELMKEQGDSNEQA